MYSKKWSFKLTEWLKFSLFGYFLVKHPKSGLWQPNSLLEILFSPGTGIGFHESSVEGKDTAEQGKFWIQAIITGS